MRDAPEFRWALERSVKIYPGIHVGMVDGTGLLIPIETMRHLYHCDVIPQRMCLEEGDACDKHVNVTN